MYTQVSTDFDVMKEFLIYGAELTEPYGFPVISPINVVPSDTIDFSESGSRKIKSTKNINVNFYVADTKFTSVWNNPDRYLQRLKYFHSICSPDFTIDTGMPLAMQIYNHYRNLALSHYFSLNGIKVIPSVNVLPYEGREWLLDGLPSHSVISCCTNGRVRARKSRLEFCEGFYQMCERLEPTKVIIVGIVPDELRPDVEIINFETRNQRINREFKHGNDNGILQEKEETDTAAGK